MGGNKGQPIDETHGSSPVGISNVNDTVDDGNSIDERAAHRLRQAADRAGGPTSLARKSGVKLATLNRYLAGREMRRSALEAIARASDVSLDWLVTGRGSMVVRDSGDAGTSVVPTTPAPGYVAIPRVNATASAGGGALAEHVQVVEYLAFDEQYLRRRIRLPPSDLLLIEARGDSMEPTIRDGEIMTVNISAGQTIEHGKLYVLRVGSNLLVKRVELRLNSLVLQSDNPRYPPETLTEADAEQLAIIGQVLLVIAPPR